MLIARVEALIAGHGVDAACERADAYAEAGADAILIHSKDKTLGRSRRSSSSGRDRGTTPLVAVPTLFPDYTADELLRQGLRDGDPGQPADARGRPGHGADAGRRCVTEGKPAAADPHIAPVDHIFDLVQHQETIAPRSPSG